MGIKKIIILLCVVFGIIAVAVLLLSGQDDRPKNLMLIENKSYFGEFYVSGNNAFIRCEIAINNTSTSKIIFEMYANLPEDVDLGLLKSERLMAYSNDVQRTHLFEIDASSTKIFSVVFIGEYAGNMQKHDRNLPKIDIIVIE